MRDEWLRLIEQYPHVAFNYKNFNGTLNDRVHGFRHIVICEPWTNMPQNWDLNVLRQYDTVIQFNPMFHEMYKHILNMRLIQGCLACNYKYNNLTEFRTYEEKIDGVCILNKFYSMGTPGDIVYLRNEIMQNLAPGFVRHVWAPTPWGGGLYQGCVDSPVHHSHVNQLKKINEYKFCVCFESTYHPFWSLGFVTERMFNCFKAKTIPIYIGCYNIEDYVPGRFFIDFRKFFRDYDVLNDYLLSITEQEYIEMTEAAFEWNKTNRIGSIEDLEVILRELK